MHPEERPKAPPMPFRPHSLPYQLRRLFDAMVLTPSDLARSCGVPVSRVEGWLRGRTPDPVTRLQIGKVLSYHARRFGDRHLKLEDEAAPIEEPQSTEGLFEELDAPPGQIEIKVRDATGGRMALLQFRADTVDDELCGDLERWHARKCPTHLQLSAESSAQTS